MAATASTTTRTTIRNRRRWRGGGIPTAGRHRQPRLRQDFLVRGRFELCGRPRQRHVLRDVSRHRSGAAGRVRLQLMHVNSGDEFTCGGSSTSFPARFRPVDRRRCRCIRTSGNYTYDASGHFHRWPTDAVQLRPAELLPASERALHRGHVPQLQVERTAPRCTASSCSSRTSRLSQIAPSRLFLPTCTVSCANPLWSAGAVHGVLRPFRPDRRRTTRRSNSGRRNIEGGGRSTGTRTTRPIAAASASRATLTKRGATTVVVPGHVAHQQHLPERLLDRAHRPRARRRRRVRRGAPTCRSVVDGTDPNCVPYNIWAAGRDHQAALNYVQIPLISVGEVTERVVQTIVHGRSRPVRPASSARPKTASCSTSARSTAKSKATSSRTATTSPATAPARVARRCRCRVATRRGSVLRSAHSDPEIAVGRSSAIASPTTRAASRRAPTRTRPASNGRRSTRCACAAASSTPCACRTSTSCSRRSQVALERHDRPLRGRRPGPDAPSNAPTPA